MICFKYFPIFIFLASFSLSAQPVVGEESQLEKLGPNVNSPSHESHPVISPDGTTLFFSRWKHEKNISGIKGGADIWFSTLDSAGNWLPAQNIGKPLNNSGHNYISAILPDGNTVLLPNAYTVTGQPSNTPGISISHKNTSGWAAPRKLEVDYFTNKSEKGDYYLSSDGTVLLMSIEYFFTYGNEDLHVSFLKEDGTWTQPKNLGKDINTKFEEVSPFLAPDGTTLYFSSNGHKGFGSKDIYYSRRLDDSWQNWSSPVNLGENINSAGMETSFVVPAAGEYAYLAVSKDSDSNSEIYRVRIPKQARPEPVVLIRGKVLNQKTKEPIQATIRYELMSDGKNSGTASSDPLTGEYKIILPSGKNNFSFYAEAEGFLSVSESYNTDSLQQFANITKNLFLAPIEIGESIALNNIFFEKSKPIILKESYSELDRLVKVLKDNPTIEIEISGHTDNLGRAELNVELSEKRVEMVKEYLTLKGISPERIKGKGYGGGRPVAPNDTEENRKKNRRVEFRILKK